LTGNKYTFPMFVQEDQHPPFLLLWFV